MEAVLDLKDSQTLARIASVKLGKACDVHLMFEGDRSGKRFVGTAMRTPDGKSLEVFVAGELSHVWTWDFLQEALGAHQ